MQLIHKSVTVFIPHFCVLKIITEEPVTVVKILDSFPGVHVDGGPKSDHFKTASCLSCLSWCCLVLSGNSHGRRSQGMGTSPPRIWNRGR